MAEWVVDRCGITHEIENRPILVLRAPARATARPAARPLRAPARRPRARVPAAAQPRARTGHAHTRGPRARPRDGATPTAPGRGARRAEAARGALCLVQCLLTQSTFENSEVTHCFV